MSIKLAIIGMGIMGCKYAKMISDGEVSGIEIAATTRISPERKELLKNIYENNVPIFPSAEALFTAVRENELTLDAVLIVTPHLVHAEQAIEAMKLGLHVLCDKPSGAYSRQAREMQEEAAKHPDLKFGMMFNQRMNPAYQKIKEIVESGRYGKLKRVNWIITDWYRPDCYYASGAWRGTWDKEGGGILLNQCPHNLDLLQWICGMPSSVQAFCTEGKYHDIEVEDEVTAYLEYENGATGTFYSTTGEASGLNRLEISLEDALLVYENNEIKLRALDVHEPDYRRTTTEAFSQPQGTWETIDYAGTDLQHPGILQNFADAISGKEELFVNGAEGGKSLTLSNAMYLSSWQKRMVKLPTTSEETLAFETEFEEAFAQKR